MDKIQKLDNASIELMQDPDCVMSSDDPEMGMLKRLAAEGDISFFASNGYP